MNSVLKATVHVEGKGKIERGERERERQRERERKQKETKRQQTSKRIPPKEIACVKHAKKIPTLKLFHTAWKHVKQTD